MCLSKQTKCLGIVLVAEILKALKPPQIGKAISNLSLGGMFNPNKATWSKSTCILQVDINRVCPCFVNLKFLNDKIHSKPGMGIMQLIHFT